MAPRISKTRADARETVIDMAAFGRELMQRRADHEARRGAPCELPRNRGGRRTPSKRALLEAIEQAGGKW